jgi:hypothetical protein
MSAKSREGDANAILGIELGDDQKSNLITKGRGSGSGGVSWQK